MELLDIAIPKFCSDNDHAIKDKATITASPMEIDQKYYIAVNNGKAGPSAMEQGDGTWDLLHMIFEGTGQLTLNYTVNWTELSAPSGSGDLNLSVDNEKLSDIAYVTKAASTYTSKNGHIRVGLIDLDATVDDNDEEGDSVPVFGAKNDKGFIGHGQVLTIANHPVSKVSGTKTYTNCFSVIAVNNGKLDGNAKNVKSTPDYVSLMEIRLAKVESWPCDDLVQVAANYSYSWTEIV